MFGGFEQISYPSTTNSDQHLHKLRYGHRIEAPLVTNNVRLKAVGRIREIPQVEVKQGTEIPPGAMKSKRQVYLEGSLIESQIYERDGLLCGNAIVGPAIVEEPFHTTLVMPQQSLQVDRLGSLIIHTGGA